MRVLYWFRKDLRLQDNPTLAKAIQNKATDLIPLYVLHQPTKTACGANRWKFLIECLKDLDEQLKVLGNRLYVVKGDARVEIPRLVKAWKIDRLAMEKLPTPHGIRRDQDILAKLGCEVVSENGTLLFDHSNLKAVYNYQSFLKQISNQRVLYPLDPLEKLPPQPTDIPYAPYWPSVKEFTSDLPSATIEGGSSHAYNRLVSFCADVDRVATFEKPETNPALFEAPSTTLLSPYIAWGCISSRSVYTAVKNAQAKSKKNKSQPPVSLIGQLLWREFYYFQGNIVENYEYMDGNTICKQIPWKAAKTKGTDGYDALTKWKKGQTGFPWIDALMRQLNATGWMHHLGRHCVACFLTRGDLFVHWERGKEYFQEKLLDHDWHLNAGNWLWLSSSAYFHQYFRVYGPVSFAKKYKTSASFVRHFVPELAQVPEKYILEPWLMPKEMQKKVQCVIGEDYPAPMVDHQVASKECLAKMKMAYDLSKQTVGQKRKVPMS